MVLQATCHQGHVKFNGSGKQCVANSVCAIVTSLKLPPSEWTVETMNSILQRGDDLYTNTHCPNPYWSSEDIPASVDSVNIVKHQYFHGTVNRKITDHPFYSIKDALTESFANYETSYAAFTMGDRQPCYTCAIIKNDGHLYFFDPHSCSPEGLPVSDGLASLSCHKDIDNIVSFIQTLSSSLFSDGIDMHYELVKIAKSPSDSLSDFSSEFSGFSIQSEGNITCRLFLAEEHVKKISEMELSDVSDVSSDDENKDNDDDEIRSFTSSVCDSVIGDILNGMNNSTEFFQSVDENAFSGLSSASDMDLDDSDDVDKDKDYNPNIDDDDEDDDDNIPLIHLIQKQTQSNSDTGTSTNTKSATNVALDSSGKHKSRKRIKNIDLWKRNVLKRRRNQGLEYMTEKGKLKHARNIKPGCGTKCRYKCHQNFSETDRQKLFHGFWQLSDINKQRNFIAKFAVQKIKKQGLSAKSRHSVSYMFPSSSMTGGPNTAVKVCKTFFLSTLSVSERYITTTHKKTNTCTGIVGDDNRGRHKNRPHKTSSEQLKFLRTHIESFPTMESHYCRKDSKKEYLSPDLNTTKMYSLYKEACQQKNLTPVSLTVYRNVFTTEYNISFHRPIKDQCDICVAYKNSLPDQKANMETEYKNHIDNKILAREHKEKDKQRSKSDESLTCACFDLQEILMTPRSFESCLYYKRRLNTFNFSLYEFGSKDGYCFLWNETISNRGACEISSCVFDFIKEKVADGKKEFIFYSDNCCSQNKNRFYVTMLWLCLRKFDIQSITHKYLEKGHTQNENDAIHSTIESVSKNIPIFTSSQWAAIIRSARREQPFKVKEMSLRDFYDFKLVSRSLKNFDLNSDGEKVYWNSIKQLQLTSDCPNLLKYKTHHGGQEFHVNLLKRLRTNIPHPCSLELHQLNQYEIHISKEKYNDLISLCRKQIIPAIHHPFYILLSHQIE